MSIQSTNSYPVLNHAQIKELQDDIHLLISIKNRPVQIENSLNKKRYTLLSHFYGKKKDQVTLLEEENNQLKRKFEDVVKTMNHQQNDYKKRKLEFEAKIQELEGKLGKIQELVRNI